MAHQRPASARSNPAALAASAMLLAIVSLGSLTALAEESGRAKAAYPAVEDVPARPAKPAMTADEAQERAVRPARSPDAEGRTWPGCWIASQALTACASGPDSLCDRADRPWNRNRLVLPELRLGAEL